MYLSTGSEIEVMKSTVLRMFDIIIIKLLMKKKKLSSLIENSFTCPERKFQISLGLLQKLITANITVPSLSYLSKIMFYHILF